MSEEDEEEYLPPPIHPEEDELPGELTIMETVEIPKAVAIEAITLLGKQYKHLLYKEMSDSELSNHKNPKLFVSPLMHRISALMKMIHDLVVESEMMSDIDWDEAFSDVIDQLAEEDFPEDNELEGGHNED